MEEVKLRIEDLSDRKIQIATNAYDLIDQHIRVVEEELKLVDAAVDATGGRSGIRPPPCSTLVND